jgi:hypothetical protein
LDETGTAQQPEIVEDSSDIHAVFGLLRDMAAVDAFIRSSLDSDVVLIRQIAVS